MELLVVENVRVHKQKVSKQFWVVEPQINEACCIYNDKTNYYEDDQVKRIEIFHQFCSL